MLNNKNIFDAITPMNKFHRMSKPVAVEVDSGAYSLDIKPGYWVKNTAKGITDTDATVVAGGAYYALCLSNANDNEYEAHDTSDFITVVFEPGVVCRAGLDYFNSDVYDPGVPGTTPPSWNIAIGDKLSIDTDGKLKAAAGTEVAIVIGLDLDNTIIEYMIIAQ